MIDTTVINLLYFEARWRERGLVEVQFLCLIKYLATNIYVETEVLLHTVFTFAQHVGKQSASGCSLFPPVNDSPEPTGWATTWLGLQWRKYLTLPGLKPRVQLSSFYPSHYADSAIQLGLHEGSYCSFLYCVMFYG